MFGLCSCGSHDGVLPGRVTTVCGDPVAVVGSAAAGGIHLDPMRSAWLGTV